MRWLLFPEDMVIPWKVSEILTFLLLFVLRQKVRRERILSFFWLEPKEAKVQDYRNLS